jgi:hypothetical protein
MGVEFDRVVVDADAIRQALSALSLAQGDPVLPTMDLALHWELDQVEGLIVDVFDNRKITTSRDGVTVSDRGVVHGYRENNRGDAVELAFDFSFIAGNEVRSIPVGPYRAGKL